MIERYFRPGVRLKWTSPGADASGTKDGSVIDNPQRVLTPMTYDGLDGELFFGGPHISTLGLSMGMAINFDWLAYVHGHTAKIRSSQDVLTGPMSGCLITSWNDGTGRCVGHVGTVVGLEDVNSKVKAKFASFMPDNTIGFNPAGAWDFGEINHLMNKFKSRPDAKVFALVTSSNEFYSLLLLAIANTNQSQWCVAGCKKIAPMSYPELKFALYGTRPRR